MTSRTTVWVCLAYIPHAGYMEPEHIFATKRDAREWVKLAKAMGDAEYSIVEYEVE